MDRLRKHAECIRDGAQHHMDRVDAHRKGLADSFSSLSDDDWTAHHAAAQRLLDAANMAKEVIISIDNS